MEAKSSTWSNWTIRNRRQGSGLQADTAQARILNVRTTIPVRPTASGRTGARDLGRPVHILTHREPQPGRRRFPVVFHRTVKPPASSWWLASSKVQYL